MRALFKSLAVVAAIAACSEQEQPTSPSVNVPAGGRASVEAVSSGDPKAPQAKPTSSFTVFDVTGAKTMLPAGVQFNTVSCPAGSQPIAGSYVLGTFLDARHVTVYVSVRRPDINGWGFSTYVDDLNTTAEFTPMVTCLK